MDKWSLILYEPGNRNWRDSGRDDSVCNCFYCTPKSSQKVEVEIKELPKEENIASKLIRAIDQGATHSRNFGDVIIEWDSAFYTTKDRVGIGRLNFKLRNNIFILDTEEVCRSISDKCRLNRTGSKAIQEVEHPIHGKAMLHLEVYSIGAFFEGRHDQRQCWLQLPRTRFEELVNNVYHFIRGDE